MSDIAEERMQNAIDELEQENRLLRARNDRLGRESERRRIALLEVMQQNSCKFPLCQTEKYQQDLAEQIKRELYTGNPKQHTWVGLTKEERDELWYNFGYMDLMIALEEKLKEKNTCNIT